MAIKKMTVKVLKEELKKLGYKPKDVNGKRKAELMEMFEKNISSAQPQTEEDEELQEHYIDSKVVYAPPVPRRTNHTVTTFGPCQNWMRERCSKEMIIVNGDNLCGKCKNKENYGRRGE